MLTCLVPNQGACIESCSHIFIRALNLPRIFWSPELLALLSEVRLRHGRLLGQVHPSAQPVLAIRRSSHRRPMPDIFGTSAMEGVNSRTIHSYHHRL
jgi:hypothetical protein